MRYLGIDFGLAKIGLALGDGETRIASPMDVIKNDDAISMIKKIVQEEGIDEIVIGIPESTGSHHSEDQKKITEEFVAEIEELGLPVHTVGEQYTSVESQRLQSEGSEMPEDALAAMLILDDFFAGE